MIAKLKKILKAATRWLCTLFSFSHYAKWIKNSYIDEKAILLESQQGKEISGNMFYILQELAFNPQYTGFKLYCSCRKKTKRKIKAILDSYNIKNVTYAPVYSFTYMKALATSKYLFNDNTFLPYFNKKEGQIYVNTWHGTPLKTLGKAIKNSNHNIGNAQKNFLFADYLLYPNEYTMEHMLEDYMLKNIVKNKIVLNGYPRNTVFFNKERAEEIRQKEAQGYNRIYAYMPTWRGALGSIDGDANDLQKEYLDLLDKQLSDDEILFVNLHPIAIKSLDLSSYKHIKKFPAQYETYDFLNCTDCLITDYSSVFYDYAVTGKKCILFAYDEEEYFADRGVYKPFSALPFPKVATVDDLLTELRSEKKYDDTDFLKEYCPYDCADATKNLLNLVIEGKISEKTEVRDMPSNGKKNVLMYAGNLDRNGITTSIFNLLNNVDRNECNYYVCFPANKAQNHQDTIAALPDGVSYIPTHGGMNLSVSKNILWHVFLMLCLFKINIFKVGAINKLLKDEWALEVKRNFGNAHFDNAIQFNGYSPRYILFFAGFQCNKTIFVHNDMVEEIRTKGNQRRDILEYAYSTYDNVALVTEDLIEPTSTFVKNTDRFKIAHNVIAYKDTVERGKLELAFDENVTQCNIEFDELKRILDSDARVIVTVGRYSPEKGHERMVDAFNRVWQDNKDTYFVIIGGYQNYGLYDKLLEKIKTMPCGKNVILVLSMSNPLPLIKACDGFILGSFYEGFGLVIVEADILGLPVVSTDITGPRLFMKNNNGTLVENTDAGVEEGFRLLIEGKVPLLTTDYNKYNENAVNEFYELLK